MQIGRKIYYELSTGNPILDTGERQGDVVETTTDQDFQLYTILQPYQQSAVGVLQMSFGQDAQNFVKYPYHVDISQNPPVIVWDTANPIGASLADVQNAKIAQLNDMYNQTLARGFNVTVNGVTYVCGATATDRGTMSATQDAINSGFISFPFDYADIYGGKVPLTSQTDLDAIKQAMTQFGFAQHKQILDLIEQVRAQTTNANGEVDAIQWTPATY